MLRLVINNNVSVTYFEDYKDAVEFLCLSFNDDKLFPKNLKEDEMMLNFSKMCDKHIDSYEPDKGKNRYRVRIKK